MKLCAFDLSLTGTGWAQAIAGSQSLVWGVISVPKPRDEMARLYEIRRRVLDLAKDSDLVVFENLVSVKNGSIQERAGLSFLIRMPLWEANIPILLVAPSQVKKFVTGRGGSGVKKEHILKELLRRFNRDIDDNNAADAVGLAYIGMALAGEFPATIGPQRQVVAALRTANPWLKKFAEAA